MASEESAAIRMGVEFFWLAKYEGDRAERTQPKVWRPPNIAAAALQLELMADAVATEGDFERAQALQEISGMLTGAQAEISSAAKALERVESELYGLRADLTDPQCVEIVAGGDARPTCNWRK